MTDHRQKARDLFFEGYNCAQSVLAAFTDVTGMSHEQSVRLASGFGAGMGGMREVCGAVTGMFMAADLLYGYTGPADKEGKAAHYALIKELAAEFAAENNSLLCRELLVNCAKAKQPLDRTDKYYGERPCAGLVMDAAAILDRLIAERGLPQG